MSEPGESTEQTRRPTSEERNAAIRAGIRPLEPGERPTALRVAATVCVLLALGNVGAALAGSGPARPAPAFVLAAFLLMIGIGIWRAEAIAVLMLQALLVITIVGGFLAALTAGNLLAAFTSVAIIFLGGWLFWSLVSVLARIQAPPN